MLGPLMSAAVYLPEMLFQFILGVTINPLLSFDFFLTLVLFAGLYWSRSMR